MIAKLELFSPTLFHDWLMFIELPTSSRVIGSIRLKAPFGANLIANVKGLVAFGQHMYRVLHFIFYSSVMVYKWASLKVEIKGI